MLDEQDATNVDKKGLPLTVCIVSLFRSLDANWSSNRFALSSSSTQRRRFALLSRILHPLGAISMRSSGKVMLVRSQTALMLTSRPSAIDCRCLINFFGQCWRTLHSTSVDWQASHRYTRQLEERRRHYRPCLGQRCGGEDAIPELHYPQGMYISSVIVITVAEIGFKVLPQDRPSQCVICSEQSYIWFIPKAGGASGCRASMYWYQFGIRYAL